MKFGLIALLLSVTLTASYAQTSPDKTAAGFWAQVDDEGHVGGWFKMFPQPGHEDEPLVTTCSKCAGDQKDAAMIGLTMVRGMRRVGNRYEDGSILDPRDGTVYHCQMELSADGQTLAVRGYLGIPLFGQTQMWRRLPDDAIAAGDIPPESVGPAK